QSLKHDSIQDCEVQLSKFTPTLTWFSYPVISLSYDILRILFHGTIRVNVTDKYLPQNFTRDPTSSMLSQ
ncbi:hypothetical protein KA005_42920, partial [bacterium]|nr:hypothetical protein [bacterium]